MLIGGRLRNGTAVFLSLLVTLLAAACDDDNGRPPTATPASPLSATDTATADTPPARPPEADLASQIGVRGDLPPYDPIDLAVRYRRTPSRAPASKPFAGEAAVGDRRDFVLLRFSAAALAHQAPPESVSISAALLAKSAHAYFYVDEASESDAADVQRAADRFESEIWPAVTGAFGEPAIPGVDGDPRILIVQSDLGGGLAGYFSLNDDLYLRAVKPISNEAEALYLDHTLRPGGEAFNAVLAHEFQHLIHARNDITEDAWVNEGLSEGAAGLLGAGETFSDAFTAQPDTQLNTFDLGEGAGARHYGAAAAFFSYLAGRFGGAPAFSPIARAQRDGTAGVDEFLAARDEQVRFPDVFADWIVANVLNADAGPYANLLRRVEARVNQQLAPGESVRGDASQFGTDYYRLESIRDGEYILRFDGEQMVDVLPAAPDVGPVLWSNAEDNVDTTLTREVDLFGASAPALTFDAWYDIERWFDYGYIAASTDGGATWEALSGGHTTTEDPVRASYGPAYTGASGGGVEPRWVRERIDLSRFAGRNIMLRFEYVTDGGTHGEGWQIDNVAIEGAASGNGELPDDEWEQDGWVRIDRRLEQRYIARLVLVRAAAEPQVIDITLDAGNAGEVRFNGAGVDDAILAIAGATEGTHQPAPYTLELRRP